MSTAIALLLVIVISGVILLSHKDVGIVILVVELKSIKLNHDFYFFMGDNRDNSWDSRFWGFEPEYHVLGKPVFAFINIFNFNKVFSEEFKKFLRFRVVS